VSLTEIVILDVGHGNCAVLNDGRGVIVIDAALGDVLLQFLAERNVTEIDSILISHADSDHIGGVVSLLCQPNINVRQVYLNPDALRETEIFIDLLTALADARKRGTEFHVGLTTTTSKDFDKGDSRLEILAPVPEVAARGAGGRDLEGRKLTSNTMSVVIRVVRNGVGEALFTGDLDAIGFENLLKEGSDLKARVLIFPHHGGRPSNADEFQFAMDLCRAVQPKLVVFSIGRGKHDTPRIGIISGVRNAVPQAHIACTQLSEKCAAAIPSRPSTHLSKLPARGRQVNACCAGTIELKFGGKTPLSKPMRSRHATFVKVEALTALCQQAKAGLKNT